MAMIMRLSGLLLAVAMLLPVPGRAMPLDPMLDGVRWLAVVVDVEPGPQSVPLSGLLAASTLEGISAAPTRLPARHMVLPDPAAADPQVLTLLVQARAVPAATVIPGVRGVLLTVTTRAHREGVAGALFGAAPKAVWLAAATDLGGDEARQVLVRIMTEQIRALLHLTPPPDDPRLAR